MLSICNCMSIYVEKSSSKRLNEFSIVGDEKGPYGGGASVTVLRNNELLKNDKRLQKTTKKHKDRQRRTRIARKLEFSREFNLQVIFLDGIATTSIFN